MKANALQCGRLTTIAAVVAFACNAPTFDTRKSRKPVALGVFYRYERLCSRTQLADSFRCGALAVASGVYLTLFTGNIVQFCCNSHLLLLATGSMGINTAV